MLFLKAQQKIRGEAVKVALFRILQGLLPLVPPPPPPQQQQQQIMRENDVNTAPFTTFQRLFYKGYYLCLICFREEIKTKEKTYNFLVLSLFYRFCPKVQSDTSIGDTQVLFYRTDKETSLHIHLKKILFRNLHIATMVLLFVLPVFLFVFYVDFGCKLNVIIIRISKMALMAALKRCLE